MKANENKNNPHTIEQLLMDIAKLDSDKHKACADVFKDKSLLDRLKENHIEGEPIEVDLGSIEKAFSYIIATTCEMFAKGDSRTPDAMLGLVSFVNELLMYIISKDIIIKDSGLFNKTSQSQDNLLRFIEKKTKFVSCFYINQDILAREKELRDKFAGFVADIMD